MFSKLRHRSLVAVIVSVSTIASAQLAGLRAANGDPDFLPDLEAPIFWPTMIQCGGQSALPQWANAYPPPFNLQPPPFRSLTSLCAANGHRRPGGQQRSGNMGGVCNTVPFVSEYGDWPNGAQNGGSRAFISEVMFLPAMAAPELYASDALLAYCMARCHCTQQHSRESYTDTELAGGWRQIRGHLDANAQNGGLTLRLRETPSQIVLQAQPHVPGAIPIPLSRIGVDVDMRLNEQVELERPRQPQYCESRIAAQQPECRACGLRRCASNSDCPASSSGSTGGASSSRPRCRCRAVPQPVVQQGMGGLSRAFAASCNIGASGFRGKRGLGEGACACNSSYVSIGCCDSDEGLVWEGPQARLGHLDLGEGLVEEKREG